MKVLIVLTNVEKYETVDRATGLWLSELTHVYDELEKNKIEADFVSPKGGLVPLDPHSIAMMDDVDKKYYDNKDFMEKRLGQTNSPKQINPEDYELIYYTGGHGTMWDFPNSVELAQIAHKIYKNGGFISAVCHGVSGLLPITNDDGSPFIEDKVLTGFTNEEEKMNATLDNVPFLTEDELRKKGGKVKIGKAFTSVVREDGRLITGQNPQSARDLGKRIVEILKQRNNK